MAATAELAAQVGTAAACQALAVPRATLYRHRRRAGDGTPEPRPARGHSPRALPPEERRAVLDELHAEQAVDKAPREVYATLLDEGRYLCSVPTMYRPLRAEGEGREHRAQLCHPPYHKPELLATAPNQVWSWDITKLPGPTKGTYFALYVVLDIYSRYVVGWLLAHRESAALAQRLIEACCEAQGIQPGQLTVHADRGSPMVAKSTAQLLVDLGVVKSHSRPHVSDDNPYSEAHFKTLKYRPDMPDRFGSIQHARAAITELVRWYNDEHYHSGLALLTPADVHHRRAGEVVAARQRVLDEAHRRHPERFVGGRPVHKEPPPAAWINPPPDALIADRIVIAEMEVMPASAAH
jgi:putative transposase